MDNQIQNLEKQTPNLSQSLITFYDDFTDFNDDCAFLCDAFSCLVNNHECLDDCSIRGLERNAAKLKKRVGEFKNRLRKIREIKN